MPDPDGSLIAEAMGALGVEHVNQLQGGAQKAVLIVRRGDERLVLKVIEIGTSTPEALRRAEREVELLASIDSDHVVRVASGLVELGDPPSGAAWLEEHLDGTDLTPLLGDPWAWGDASTMALHVALGLGAAHVKKVVHRDLSANNVRRLSGGTYKVMDFGFARHTLRSGLTIAGQPGTLGFASPEHLHGYSGSPTAASDVFAVGILLFYALTGGPPIPFLGDEADYARRLLAVKTRRIEELRPDLSDDQQAIVKRCLHPQPARRYLNGSLLASALEAVAP